MPNDTHTSTTTRTYAIGARTDRGMQRSANEDALAVIDVAAAGLAGVVEAAFVVADGMGGLSAGDIASGETIQIVHETLIERFRETNPDPALALNEALRRANAAVHAMAQEAARSMAAAAAEEDAPTERRIGQSSGQPPAIVMGTTCVAGVVQNGTLYVAHVGDSRAYRLRGGRLERLTRDHSYVEERVIAGDMTEAEARTSRFRNMVTRAIGIDANVVPDIRQEPFETGDMLLVCSDGLTTMLDDAEIQALMTAPDAASAHPDNLAATLIEAANRKGGSDNITVVLLRDAQAGEPALVASGSPESLANSRSTQAAGRAASASAPPRANGREGGGVADLDTASALRSGSGRRPRANRDADNGILKPLMGVFALFGLCAVVFAGALTASDDLRQTVSQSLVRSTPPRTGGDSEGSGTTLPPPPSDFSRLAYDKPQAFADVLARGDLLAYAPGTGLYFVAGSSGKVALLSLTGEVVRAVGTFPFAPPPATPIPVSHNFLTTDPQGNVYLVFTSKKRIEKRAPSGQLLVTLTGFERPEAVAVDERGNLYVVDYDRIKVLRARTATVAAPPATKGKVAPAKPAPSQSGAPAAAPARKPGE